MLGHYLLSLTPAQEERVLQRPFEPVMYMYRRDRSVASSSCRCLVLCATNGEERFAGRESGDLEETPGLRYEELAYRFGTARINAAIRNRILANQARRALSVVRAHEDDPVEAA